MKNICIFKKGRIVVVILLLFILSISPGMSGYIKEIERTDISFAEEYDVQDNNVLFGQADFLDYHIMSHSRNFDLFINNTITQTSPFPVGNYKFRLVLKDVFSQKTTEAIIEFTVTE